jgi:hypothetical protein
LCRLGCILLASGKTRWWGTNSTVGAGSDSHNVRMDSTRDTVLRLSVKLWESVTFVDASFLNISNSSLLNNVPYDKSLNRLVLSTREPKPDRYIFNLKTNLEPGNDYVGE